MEQEKNQENGLFRQLIDVKKEDVNLKFIFDNIRNLGITSTVIVAGFYLFKYGAIINNFPGARVVMGVSIMLLGFFLLTLNIGQAIIALTKFKISMILYFIFSMVLFLGATELVWVLVRQFE